MCGIVAILAPRRPVSEETLGRAVASLHHRGPDGQGTWVSPDRRAALGHARLSIIDLETGAQPIANETGDIHIVVNGEFYDFERTRRTLERAGHRFRTRSDSEIALHLYEDHGVKAVQHLRGEFAFTLWDDRRGKLYAFRDRYGVKPLYYSLHDGDLYVASEVKALFAAGVPARWDAEALHLGIALRGPERTPFQGVLAVPPGHYLESGKKGGLRLVKYWDIDYPAMTAGEDDGMPERERVEAFRSLLDEAVRLRLRADVPVACYLSGGLDSCAILGLAARHRSEPVQAFTIRFADDAYDEGPIAREMAAQVGAHYAPLEVREDDLADSFADAVYHAEGPCTNAHGIAKFLLSRQVRRAGFKVVLTGEGADEVLAGYPHFQQDMLLHGRAGSAQTEGDRAEIARGLRELYERNELSHGRLLPDAAVEASPMLRDRLGFTPGWMMVHFARMKSRGMPLNYDYFAEFAARDPGAALLDSLDAARHLAGRAPVHQALYLWAKTMLPNYILATLGDRMEMAHSVEGRLPFLDHKLGEFLQTTPLGLKIRGPVEKYILREATRDVVTERVYRRHKHPFLSPPVSLQPGSRFFDLVRDTLLSADTAAVPFLDTARLRKVADMLAGFTAPQREAAEPRLLFTLSIIFLHRRLGLEG
jgi:asparagine synthase (glutamine-hydrolysing)